METQEVSEISEINFDNILRLQQVYSLLAERNSDAEKQIYDGMERYIKEIIPDCYTFADTVKRNIPLFDNFNLDLYYAVKKEGSFNKLCFDKLGELKSGHIFEKMTPIFENCGYFIDLCEDIKNIKITYFDFEKSAINEPLKEIFEKIKTKELDGLSSSGDFFLWGSLRPSYKCIEKTRLNCNSIDESFIKLMQTCVGKLNDEEIKTLIEGAQTLSSIDDKGIKCYLGNMYDKIEIFNTHIEEVLNLFYENQIVSDMEEIDVEDIVLSENMESVEESVRLCNLYLGNLDSGNSEDVGNDILSFGTEFSKVIKGFDKLVTGGKFNYSVGGRKCCSSKFYSSYANKSSIIGMLYKFDDSKSTTGDLNLIQEKILKKLGFDFYGYFDRSDRTAKITYEQYDKLFNS